MKRPPGEIALVARAHWAVGATIFGGVALLTAMFWSQPVGFSAKTYAITLSLGTAYVLAGTLVWFGAPFGRILSRMCGLIYVVRPGLGFRLWRIMDSPEFKAHFERRR